jgi:hypothetical protein
MWRTKKMTNNLKPEVEAFIEAADRYERVKAFYEEAVAALTTVQEEYNSALAAAEKIVREEGLSQGPFQVSSKREKVDGAELHRILGEDQFLAIGGTITTERVYRMDIATLKAKMAIKVVEEAVVKSVIATSYVYRNKPNPISLP